MSLRDQILATDDIQTEMVEVPEWDVTLEVRGMSGADRSRVLDAAAATDGKIGVGAMYTEAVIASCYDPETGERVFSPDDAGVLMTKSASAIDRIALVAMRLSGMETGAEDEAKKQFPEAPGS